MLQASLSQHIAIARFRSAGLAAHSLPQGPAIAGHDGEVASMLRSRLRVCLWVCGLRLRPGARAATWARRGCSSLHEQGQRNG